MSQFELAIAHNGLIPGNLDVQARATERFLRHRRADLLRWCERDACLVLTARPLPFDATRPRAMSYANLTALMLGRQSPLHVEPLHTLLSAGPRLSYGPGLVADRLELRARLSLYANGFVEYARRLRTFAPRDDLLLFYGLREEFDVASFLSTAADYYRRHFEYHHPIPVLVRAAWWFVKGMRLVRGTLWLSHPGVRTDHVDLGSCVARNLAEEIDAVGVPIAERMWAALGYKRGFLDRADIKPEPIDPESPRLAGGRFPEMGRDTRIVGP
jgi:hypothetical protein